MQIPQQHLEHPHPSQGQWLGWVGWAHCHSLIPQIILLAGEGKNTHAKAFLLSRRSTMAPRTVRDRAGVAPRPQPCRGNTTSQDVAEAQAPAQAVPIPSDPGQH